MCYMQDLVKKDSRFIISTHSPILMTFPGAEVLEITEEGIRAEDFRDTEHFLITKRFMDAPEKMVRELLGGLQIMTYYAKMCLWYLDKRRKKENIWNSLS